jgi:hypothetical protein
MAIKREADRGGVAVPTRAWLAIGLGALSVGVFGVVLAASLAMGLAKERGREGTAQLAASRLEGKRGALDERVACDLVTEYLLRTKPTSYDAVSCTGALQVAGDSAVLAGVIARNGAEPTTLQACLHRGARWFVLHAEAEVPCPGVLPATAADADDEARARRDFVEARARAAATADEQKDAAALAGFRARLARVRAALVERRHRALACPTFPGLPPGERREVPYVDFDLLNAGATRQDHAWEFLTRADLRGLLAPGAGDRRRKAAEVAGAGELVVFVADQRAWPEVSVKEGVFSDDLAYVSGAFTGWLVVVDADTAAVRCEAPFAFANSPKVSIRKRGPDKQAARLDEVLLDDLRGHFEDAATAVIAKLTTRQLRLGIKLLE